jgi:hypothetical protein
VEALVFSQPEQGSAAEAASAEAAMKIKANREAIVDDILEKSGIARRGRRSGTTYGERWKFIYIYFLENKCGEEWGSGDKRMGCGLCLRVVCWLCGIWFEHAVLLCGRAGHGIAPAQLTVSVWAVGCGLCLRCVLSAGYVEALMFSQPEQGSAAEAASAEAAMKIKANREAIVDDISEKSGIARRGRHSGTTYGERW